LKGCVSVSLPEYISKAHYFGCIGLLIIPLISKLESKFHVQIILSSYSVKPGKEMNQGFLNVAISAVSTGPVGFLAQKTGASCYLSKREYALATSRKGSV
jgi:hypothetical protein